jgi:hypothetical protein
MAIKIIGAGAVTSWAGNNNTNLIDNASAPPEFTLAVNSDSFPTTAFGSVTAEDFANGLYSWTASIASRLEPFSAGGGGLVTYADGYTANVKAWSMTMNWAALESTVFDSAGTSTIESKSFTPGLLNWSGTYTAILDDTTALSLPEPGTRGTATFKIVEDGANDQTLAGTVITTSVSAPVRVGQLSEVSIGYQGAGPLAATGTSGSTWTANFFDYWIAQGGDRHIGLPATGELVLTAHSGRTYTGDAFATSIALNVAVGQPVTVNVTAQGSGDLAVG